MAGFKGNKSDERDGDSVKMASMKKLTRRDVCVALPVAVAASAVGVRAVAAQSVAQAKASEASPQLAEARVFAYDQLPVRKMANGGESRNIVHGTLATGETVNLHESMQVAGAKQNPLHVIEHTEFILVQEGELEFEHELNGKVETGRVGPGGVIYVAYGTRHTVKNVGSGPAKYFVVAIGGNAK